MMSSKLGEKFAPVTQFVVDSELMEGKQALDRLKMQHQTTITTVDFDSDRSGLQYVLNSLMFYSELFALAHNVPEEWPYHLKPRFCVDQHPESDKRTHRK